MGSVRDIWNQGTTQRARRQQRLSEPTFQVDERTFEMLVKEVSDYAKEVAFISVENIKNPTAKRQSWSDFLAIDEIVVLAHLRALDIKSMEDRFHRSLNKIKQTENNIGRRTNTMAALKEANILGDLFKTWHSKLSKIPKNAPHYPIYLEWDMALKKTQSTTSSFKRIAEEYQQGSKELTEQQVEALENFFNTLVKTAFFLMSKYDRFMELTGKHQSHQPHNALLFTFLKLFNHAQKRINSFHRRHLDFYYREHLKLNPFKASADQVFLQFELAEQVKNHLLPQSTPFIVGQDEDGDDITYQTVDDLLIDQSRIKRMEGLFVKRDENALHPEVSPAVEILSAQYPLEPQENPWPVLDLSSEYSREFVDHAEIGFAISSPNLALNEGERKIRFGFHGSIRFLELKKEIKKDIHSLTLADAREYLQLKEGEEITLEKFFSKLFKETNQGTNITKDFAEHVLYMQGGKWANTPLCQENSSFPPSMTVEEMIKRLEEETNLKSNESILETIKTMLRRKKQPATATPLQKRRAEEKFNRKFSKLFINAFSISYSSEEEWQFVAPVSVAFTSDKKTNSYTLQVVVLINQDLPGVITNPALGFEAPTLRFMVNPDASVYAYDFLEKIKAQRITCNIDVTNVRDLLLYNQVGQINPDAPFLPFGPVPNNYSYLLIGNKEIFRKRLSKLKLHVEWMDLPAYRGGFKVHYAKYGTEVNNQSFKMEVSSLNSGTWIPKKKERQEETLFTGEELLDTEKNFNITIPKLNAGSDFSWDPDPFEYNKLSKRGFLKLQLTEPSGSFGHEAYPNLLSKVAVQNAKKLTGVMSVFLKKDFQMELPPAPYTPKMDRISFDYSVDFEMDFRPKSTKGKMKENVFYHLRPFGGTERNPIQNNSIRLVPSFRYEGVLYVGIENFESPGTLSLLFQMKEREVEQDANERSTILWSYLQNNQWNLFKQDQIPVDSTENLIHSGIVKLDVPTLKLRYNTILDPSLLWIRISASRDTHILGEVISISTHAIEAKYVAPQEKAITNQRILPNSVVGPVDDIPQLAKINQPLPSFGGFEEESDEKFKIRVSERLRHKKRCVNLYDYERLVLEAFPDINKVLCINSYNWRKNKAEAGKVLLVLVPLISEKSLFDLVKPTCSISMLRKAKELVASHSSPFIEVSAINPTYEKMRVFAKVKIQEGKSAGYFLRQLNIELKEFISPWLKDPNHEPRFQKRISREEVQSFIQSRNYVDFVTKVSMIKVEKGERTPTQRPYKMKDTGMELKTDNEIEGLYPWSILTTANQHHLESIEEDTFIPPDHAGIDELYLDEDFVISTKEKQE